MTRMQQVWEKAAVYGIWTGIVLILLTPFVVTPDTIFPFVVGKAVYSRSLIECVFGVWAILALFRPAYRPPRSRLLLLLALSVGVSILAACFGVSPQRSFWSTYERMQGVVDLIHWFAFAVVLASVLRTERDCRLILNINVGASLVMAVLAICLYYSVDVSLFDYHFEMEAQQFGVDGHGRAYATVGNALHLGAYMLINFVVAAGFLIRSAVSNPFKPTDALSLERGWQTRLPQGERRVPLAPWIRRCFWGGTMLLSLWTLSLTGSRGAILGLLTGIGFLAAVYLFLGQTRLVRFAAVGSLGLLACLVGSIAFFLFEPLVSPIDVFSNPLLKRVLTIDRGNTRENTKDEVSSYSDRIEAWRTGVGGFIEKPGLGWGPENFLVVFGRYASGYGSDMNVHSYAHSEFVENAATKGTLGLSTYLALWTYTFVVVVGLYRIISPKDHILPLFVGAALTGYFIQSQLSVPAASSSLQHTILLAFVDRLEAIGERSLAYGSRWAPVLYDWISTVGVVVILMLVGIGIFANQAIYSTASSIKKIHNPLNTSSQSINYVRQTITGFEPLANAPRITLFENFPKFWTLLQSRDQRDAERLLAYAETEAAAALAAEPENWLIHSNLAAMYRAVAVHNPEYDDVAKWYSERALELAPHRIETTLAAQ